MAHSAKSPAWYFRRLTAMGPSEIAMRVRSALRRRGEKAALPKFLTSVKLHADSTLVPALPEITSATLLLKRQVASEAAKVLAGQWILLHGHEVNLTLPPNWQKDYLGGGVADGAVASRALNYRAQAEDLDPRVVWELSRWTQLVRLAQHVYLSSDAAAEEAVLSCLEDWIAKNPVGYGMNWTSPMEPGLRLINFTWIHRLLGAVGLQKERLQSVAEKIVPGHVWWVWRYQSYGSSANNHLLGELAGLILAVAHWPQCAAWSAPLEKLAETMQKELLRQFWSDGGNKEVSLHYHLFALELGLQAVSALEAAGAKILPEVKNLLGNAGAFFAEMAAPTESWDFGDSDDAHVTPFYSSEADSIAEWQAWFCGEVNSFHFWLGAAPSATELAKVGDWTQFEQSGYAVCRRGGWLARLDASPLGFGSIAAHGQLDLLHVSLWRDGRALIIDPGTGTYFGNPSQREHFVSRQAHNGPHFAEDALYPPRFGAFLWGTHHAIPHLEFQGDAAVASCALGTDHTLTRLVNIVPDEVQVVDTIQAPPDAEFAIHWQLAPGLNLEKVAQNRFKADLLEIEILSDPCILTEIAAPAPCAPFYKKVQTSSVLKISGKVSETLKIQSRFSIPAQI